MSILNQASDGLPSVLMALVRALRAFGPQSKDDLLALCCPPSLQDHTSGFADQKLGKATLARWTQLGLFMVADDGRIQLHPQVANMPDTGLAEVRALGHLLRTLLLSPENNEELNEPRGHRAADVTLALSWALAQDVYSLPGGAYDPIGRLEQQQFGVEEPYAFRNNTRWNGFRAWAPLLGFGWTEKDGRASLLVVDPTDAVRDALSLVFEDAHELSIDSWISRVGQALPVLDGGIYRTKVEARLDEASWRRTTQTEVSVSLSAALLGLEVDGSVRLDRRSDAPHRSLLGRAHREIKQVSHVVWKEGPHA